MLLIPCPYCGERNEAEFHYGDQAHIARPDAPNTLNDAQWAQYVYMRNNHKGAYLERWVHSAGCGKWFNAARDTVTSEIVGVYKAGEEPPIAKDKQGGHV